MSQALDKVRATQQRCTFVSVWDGSGEIRTRAIYHTDDFYVESLESVEVEDPGVLKDEYIELPDGSRLPICTHCHEYTLQKVGSADPKGHIEEYLRCPSCHAFKRIQK